jgi:ABC-type dipeptide/oligopeptide/nickel transport system permease component
MTTGQFVLRRLGVSLVQLLALALAVFFLIRMLPADPVARLVGQNPGPEAYASAKASIGLDQPVLVQLQRYLGLASEQRGLLQGDLGRSWVSGGSVAKELSEALPITIELVTIAFILAFLISVPIGMSCAIRPDGVVDQSAFAYSLFAGSQPEFWWGILFVYIFFFVLDIAPPPLGRLDPLINPPPFVTGFITVDSILAGRWDALWSGLHHLMLPILTKVFVLSGPIIKMVRQNMVRVLQSDFILYANAAGLPPTRVARYALRSALAPSIALFGALYGYILGGAVVIETIFSLGGIGQYAVRSILSFDYPAIQATILVITAISLFVYLMLDIVHAIVDPRVAH